MTLVQEEHSANITRARQRHGFVFEQIFISATGCTPCPGETSPWDAFAPDGLPVSIKYKPKGRGSIELGSLWRNASIDHDFYFVLGEYTGNAHNHTPASVTVIKIPGKLWQKQFPERALNAARTLIGGATCDKSYDAEWKRKSAVFRKERLAIKKELGTFVTMCPKRDSKKQLRIQCALPRRSGLNVVLSNEQVYRYTCSLEHIGDDIFSRLTCPNNNKSY